MLKYSMRMLPIGRELLNMNNILSFPTPVNQLSDDELEEERINLLANDDLLYNERYMQIVHEIVRRMYLMED